MIKDYRDGKLIQVCVKCGREREVDVPQEDLRVNYLGLYDAVPLPPCECGTIEFLNPDLPPMNDEGDIVDLIPDSEWNQRHIVRTIMSAKKLRRPLPQRISPVDREMVKRARQERMRLKQVQQNQQPPST